MIITFSLLTFLIYASISHTTYANKYEDECVYLDYVGKELNITDVDCPKNDICHAQRRFNISYIHFPPYFRKSMGTREDPIARPIQEILKQCCGSCTNFEEVNIFKNISEISASLMNSSDFIYPFFASSSTTRLHGYHYIPYVDIPHIIYVTEKKRFGLNRLLYKIYPITIICILLSIISGFVCWLLETWCNKEEFPRTFLIGWFEGFWWSFVSMTTVGYGDKSPRSHLGRIFSVIWISIGIIAYGLLTGLVYAEVANVNSPPPPDINGATVGSVLYRDYDAYMVAENGGKLVQNKHLKPRDFYVDVLHLIDMLQKKEVNGFVLDEYALVHTTIAVRGISTNIKKGLWTSFWFGVKDPIGTIDFFLEKTMGTKIPYSGVQQLTYGILVKHLADYNFFKDVIKDRRFRARARWDMQVYKYKSNHITDKLYHPLNELYSSSGYYFKNTVIAVFSMIGAICVFGIAFELQKKYFNVRSDLATGVAM